MKLVKDLTIEEVNRLCHRQQEFGGCDKCPYKLFEVKLRMPQNNNHVEGYSVCIVNSVYYGYENEVDINTGVIREVSKSDS